MIVAALLLVTGCSRDDGASVRNIGGTGTGTETGTGSGTGSGTGTGTGTAAPPGKALGPYEPVSDVVAHAKTTLDVCDINAALPDGGPMDYGAGGVIYAQGKHSARPDGTKRTLKGFATGTLDEPYWKAYAAHFGDPAWLNTFVEGAVKGTGAFQGEPDAVRRQGVQKGVQNQILIAWTLHELDAALVKVVGPGNVIPETGAPHAVDEAWAFYHGEKPDCSPYLTADRRGADFGTGTAVNDAVTKQFKAALAAAQSGNAEGLRAAVDEIVRQITITYVQAALKYAAGIDGALKAGDAAKARAQQAEGWSFFRVIEPLVAKADPEAARRVAGVFDLGNKPAAGAGDAVRQALEGAYGKLRIESPEIGTLKQ